MRARLYVDADAVLTPLLRGIAVDTSSGDQLAMLQRTLLSRPNLRTLIAKTDLGLAASTEDARERMIDKLATAITLELQERNLFAIQYQNANPRLARDVVLALLSIFIESATSSNRSEMENAQRFLRLQIASYEQQLHAMEERRADFRAKYAGMLPLDGGVGSSVESARDAVSRLEVQLQDAQGREKQLKGQLQGMPEMLPGADLRGFDPTAPGDGGPLARAEATLRELRTLYTDDYPGVIEQKKLIEQLRRIPDTAPRGRGLGARSRGGGMPNALYDQLMVKLVDEEAGVASLTHQLQLARVSLDRIEKVRHDQPALLAEYENLDRDYGVLRKNYDELLGRLQAATIAEAADTQADKVHLRVIDPPEIPLLPTGPNRPLLLSAILVAGIGAGVASAVLLAQFDRSFATLDDLRALGLPVLGGLSTIGGPSARRKLLAVARFGLATIMLIGLYGGLLVRLLHAHNTI